MAIKISDLIFNISQNVIGILLLPLTVYAHRQTIKFENRLEKVLMQQNRVVNMSIIENDINAGNGTVVIERNFTNVRFWWFPDKIDKSIIGDFYFNPVKRIKISHPFIEWCYLNLLNIKTGKARLILFSRMEDFDILENIISKTDHFEIPFIITTTEFNKRMNV